MAGNPSNVQTGFKPDRPRQPSSPSDGNHGVLLACRFQLLGLACLRAAMGDARKPAALDEQSKKMDPANFAYISDDTYTAEEVEAQTQVGGGGTGGLQADSLFKSAMLLLVVPMCMMHGWQCAGSFL